MGPHLLLSRCKGKDERANMSYAIMKQKQLPPRFGEDQGMTVREIVELGILTLTAIAMGIGAIWFIIEVIKIALGGQ